MNQGPSASGGAPREEALQREPAAEPPAGAARPEIPTPATDGPIRRTLRVINPRGLHPRIIELFTKTAKKFAATVTLWNGEMRGDGKDVWDLITLLVLPDTDVILEVDGPDAVEAIEPLAEILSAPGGEDYKI